MPNIDSMPARQRVEIEKINPGNPTCSLVHVAFVKLFFRAGPEADKEMRRYLDIATIANWRKFGALKSKRFDQFDKANQGYRWPDHARAVANPQQSAQFRACRPANDRRALGNCAKQRFVGKSPSVLGGKRLEPVGGNLGRHWTDRCRCAVAEFYSMRTRGIGETG
jgi:hypothetical protein